MCWQMYLPALRRNNFQAGQNPAFFLLFKPPFSAKYQNIPTNCIIPQVTSICQFKTPAHHLVRVVN